MVTDIGFGLPLVLTAVGPVPSTVILATVAALALGAAVIRAARSKALIVRPN